MSFTNSLQKTNFQILHSQTKLLTSLVNQGHHHKALTFFLQMFSSLHLHLDDPFAFPLALKSATALHLPNFISSIHSHSTKSGLLSNPFIASSLVDSYGKCGTISHARQVFDESPQRNVIVWNAMISQYAKSNDIFNATCLLKMMDVRPNASTYNSIIRALSESEDGKGNRSYQAIELYRHMQDSGLEANFITILALLPAFVDIGSLNSIREIHGFGIRRGMCANPQLVSGLVEAYGRCGCLVNARVLFDRMHKRDVVVYSSMISAYAFHGNPQLALSLFQQMELERVLPDEIMFLSVIKACSHSGLAEDALNFFEIMKERYGIEASRNHYSCLVDVLSRAGRLKEAYEVVKGMPMEASAKAWGAILGGCRSYGEVELAEIAGRVLFEMEPENAGNYVLLASVYSRAGKLEEAERVRREMEERGLKRNPGSSWVM